MSNVAQTRKEGKQPASGPQATPGSSQKAAPVPQLNTLPPEIFTYVKSHPGMLADALINGTFLYTYPNLDMPVPPAHFAVSRLRPVLDQMNADELRAVQQAILSRAPFFPKIAKVFGYGYAAALRKKMGGDKPAQLTEAQLTADAFIEQLAERASYMNAVDLDSTNKDIDPKTGKSASNFQGKNLLSYFGYTSDFPIFGQWGFQMRVFRPDPNAKNEALTRRNKLGLNDPIVVFRGTEGVQINTTEGGVDTVVGDMSKASVGMEQVRMNAELIESTLSRVKTGIFAGHSLGGGLAQVVAAQHPAKVVRVVTFQSPGLPAELAAQFARSNHSQAHHYRVHGDLVPTAGKTFLPGQINYFDRFAKAKGATNFGADLGMSSTHVAFPLTTLLQGRDAKSLTSEQNAILKYGAHDRSEVSEGAQARVLYESSFDLANDPRSNLEWLRKSLGNTLVNDLHITNNMAEANIGYNALLEAVQPKLKAATTFEQFKAVYDWLSNVKSLPLSKEQENFVRRLGVKDRQSETATITFSKDPAALLPKLEIPTSTVLSKGKPSFLGMIKANGNMVPIEAQQMLRLRNEIAMHWSGQHAGKPLPAGWLAKARK